MRPFGHFEEFLLLLTLGMVWLFVRGPRGSLADTMSPLSFKATPGGDKNRSGDNLSLVLSHLLTKGNPFRWRKARKLQVYFTFNGHDFEAHEVLGLPYGAPWVMIETRFHELPAEERASEFVRLAFEALKSHCQNK